MTDYREPLSEYHHRRVYYFVIHKSATFKLDFPGSDETLYSVKIPDPDNEVVTILSGGDSGHNEWSQAMNQ